MNASNQKKFEIDEDKYKSLIKDNEKARKINNEVWWIMLRFLGFYDFIE